MNKDLLERNETTDDQLVIIREFAVPRHQVFQVLSEQKWSSPKNFDVTFSEGDLKVGGKYRFGMRSGEGPEFVLTGEYKEISHPDKLVYTQARVNPDGSPSPGTTITIELEEHEGKTAIVFQHSGFPSKEYRDGAIHGWNEAFEKLEFHLTSLK
jgi:uncharacterized protein YndB with AHSA1/START domain